MEIGVKTRRPIRPPANERWPSGASSGSLIIKWPVTFKTREAFEGFIRALEEASGNAVDIQISLPPRGPDGFLQDPAILHSVDELFRHTERPLYEIVFRTAVGHIGIDNKSWETVSVGYPDPPGSETLNAPAKDAQQNSVALARALARYATAKWAIRLPWRRRIRVVTRVPEAEARNRVWELSVGGASVFLGGLAGVLGGVLTNTH